jgi:hypothetical protein
LAQDTVELVAQLKKCSSENTKAALVASLLEEGALRAVLSVHWYDTPVTKEMQALAKDNGPLQDSLLAIAMDKKAPNEMRKGAISSLAESLHVPKIRENLSEIALSYDNSDLGYFAWFLLSQVSQPTPALANTLER